MYSKERVRVADQADEVQRGAEEGVGGGDAEDGDAEPAGRRQDGSHPAREGHEGHPGRPPMVSNRGQIVTILHLQSPIALARHPNPNIKLS